MPDHAGEQTIGRAVPIGVNLVGYLSAPVGLGQVARRIRAGLELAGVAVAPVDLPHRAAPEVPPSAGDAPHAVSVVCVNPEGMAGARALAPAAFAAERVVGVWWWEVMAFPARWLRAFDDVHEVWVGSRFVADALAAVAPVPVVRVPLALAAPATPAGPPAGVALPDAFTFGFAFDHGSVLERKNPVGLVTAFRRAFPDGDDGVALVLKTLGAERHPDEHARVLAAAGGDPRVHVVDRLLEPGDMDALIAALDCYVSLHRSEGFGLTIAEAMALGTPVVATDYSGPRDFLTPFNGFPVDHRVVAIGPGHDPYPPEGEWAEPDLHHAAAQLRAVRERPDEAAARAARARTDLARLYAPAAAGAAMADRLARLLDVPLRAAGPVDALDLASLRARVQGGAGAPDPRAGRARSALRDAVLRLLRPYTVHQRAVDEELLAVVRTLDERVRGTAAAQRALAAELARLRRAVERDDG
jgi:Glycosyl transferases group 1